MSTPTVIANLALSYIGWSVKIANINDNNDKAAIACKQHYDIVKKTIFEEYIWNFAEKRASLALIPTGTYDPADTTEFTYAYAYPGDCLVATEIYNSAGDSQKIDFELQTNATRDTVYILTNTQDAILIYTAATDSFTLMRSGLFQTAFAYRLAAAIAFDLTKDSKIEDKNFNKYFGILAQAKVKDANEGTVDVKRTDYKDAFK